MDSDEDFELFSEEAAPPVRETKLKRLKKAIRRVSISEEPLLDKSESDRVNSSEFEALSLEESNEPSGSRIGSESLRGEREINPDFDGFGGEAETNSGFDGLGGEGESNSGLDGLGGEGEANSGSDGLGCEGEMNSSFDGLGGGEDGSGAKRVLDFGSVVEEFPEEGEDRNQEMPEESGDMRMNEPDKKRRSSDCFEENKDKKKSKRAKSEITAAKGKRRTEKERRDHLKQLHAESQRLLRETRDAAFKPIPLVQKPISSVLEKIRKRKLEVLQKCSGTVMGSQLHAIEEPIASRTEMGSIANGVSMDRSNDDEEQSSSENVSSQMDVDKDSKQAFRAPIDDTQELFSDSQTTDSKDDLPNDAPRSPLEEVFAPSILAMNLKLDSAPPYDVSSDEEDDNDKENINPHPTGVSDLPSSPIGDPVKAFVDDEAEEEDDSDHDLFRFQDSEEDEEDGDAAELNDMIATGYEERPMDSEKRNELHQKWLEQQDASGTEKLMQKLKFGSNLKETRLLEEKDADGEKDADREEDADGEKDEYGEEDTNAVQMSLRQIKQMIPLMFTDNDDAYLSSDDDETEKRLAKQCLSEKAEEQATFLSPAEDESCREAFGFIKKLNVVSDTKKAKTPSFSSVPLMGGDRDISSKSSFLGWGSNHSLPSSRKHGLGTVRSIIFGRGGSNSRSTSSVLEDSSDTIQRENPPTRTTSARLSNSKVMTSSQKSSPEAVVQTDSSAEAVPKANTSAEAVAQTDASAEAGGKNTGTSPSLLKILRQSSLHAKRCTAETMIGQTQIESVLASFKVGRKPVQTKRRT
ncbi:PREDICTED: protein IWS1 homolog [Prunus mume]|uniref:Protein IWS1 homolog n=1 Tax=Prunus mume TaxID=102107 RepID=A0ABM0N7T9_PRUMU|nr:PREDICTED: protein IWS1 homolog [Prunus mume]